MPYNEELAALLDAQSAGWNGLTVKKMFGGKAWCLHGNVCLGIWHDQAILRVGKDLHEVLAAEPWYHPFDITGKVMRGWVMMSSQGWQDPATSSISVSRPGACPPPTISNEEQLEAVL